MTSSRLALLTLCLGLALGFGTGFFAGGSNAPISHAASDPDVGTYDRGSSGAGSIQGERRETAELARVGSMISSNGASDGSPAVIPSYEAKTSARRIATSVNPGSTDTSEWTETLQGSVLDLNGTPIAGATVISFNEELDSGRELQARLTKNLGRAYTGPGDADAGLAESIEQKLIRQRNTRTSESDAAGSFTLSGLRPGQHNLRAWAEGYTFERTRCETGSVAQVVGIPVKEFELDIRLPDGSTPEKAILRATTDGNGRNYTWTREEPVLRIDSEALDFTVYAGNVRSLSWRETVSDYVSGPQSLHHARDGRGPHVIDLTTSQVLRVTVTDSSKLSPRIRPWVKVIAVDHLESESLPWESDEARSLRREERGLYATKDLANGSYVIGVGRGGGNVEVTMPVAVTSGLTTAEANLGTIDMSSFIVATCLTPTGGPALGVDFSVAVGLENDGNSRGGVTAHDRGRGEYWLTLKSVLTGEEWTDVKSVQLTAKSSSYGMLEQSVLPSTAALSLQFFDPCELVVSLRGDASAGYSASLSRVDEDLDDEGRIMRQYQGMESAKRADKDGNILFTGLQPGQYEIAVRKTGTGDRWRNNWRATVVSTDSLTLRQGTQDLAIVLPTLHKLTVHAPAVEEGTRFNLSPAGIGADSFTTGRMRANLDANKRAVFEDVPAGSYNLTSRDANGTSVAVTVPSGEVIFEVKVPNSLRVSRVAPGKLGAKAGLKNNDLITAVNGKTFNAQVGPQLITGQIFSGAVTLTIERGTETLEVMMGPLDPNSAENVNGAIGFRMRPFAR